MSNPWQRRLALGVVLLHAVVGIVHGAAHKQLQIDLPLAGDIYVMVVIFFAPLVAAGLLLTRYQRGGAWLLTGSMLGSLAFGVYHHYLAMSPDHVTQTPDTGWGAIFRVTAALLAATETAGLLSGVWLLTDRPARTVEVGGST